MNNNQNKSKKYNIVKIILGISTLAFLIYLMLNKNILPNFIKNTLQNGGVLPVFIKDKSISNNIFNKTCKNIIECQNILDEIM